MKRNILAVGLFSLCCLALFSAESQAFFGLLSPYHPASLWHRNNRYVTQITCRPYNAFTPIAWGNIVCDGCNPNPCGVASGQLPMNFGVPPFASLGCCGMPNMGGCGMPNMGGACGPAQSYASDMPMMSMQQMPMQMPMQQMPMQQMPMQQMPMQQGPMQQMPDIRSAPFTPPMPMPYGPGANISMYPQPGVAQANYYPQYVPQYNPNYYMPTYFQPAPYYWYGNGR